MSENKHITNPLVSALEQLPYVVVHRLHSGGVKVKNGYMHLEKKGTPDLLVLVSDPHGERPHAVCYMETKAADGVVKPHQAARHQTLRAWGFRVEVPRSKEEGLRIVKEMIERQAERKSA